MSLGAVLENSPIVRKDWEAYLNECESSYVAKTKDKNNERKEEGRDNNKKEINSVSIPILKNR